MTQAYKLDDRWKMEQALDLRRRIMLMVLALIFLIINLYQAERPMVLIGLSIMLVLYIFSLFLPRLLSAKNYSNYWWIGFLLDLTFVGYLIGVYGNISSPFTLLYPLAMIGAALSCPRVKDFLIAGALGHISYATAVFSFTGNFSFYREPVFWIEGGLNGVVFLLSVEVVQFFIKDREKLFHLTQELENKNKRLEEMAITDGLTGLYNHKCFWERIEEEVERTKRGSRKMTVAMCDIDFFKTYNDRLGHLQGDQLLRQLSGLLQEKLRKGDVVFRYGGEEFAVILPETNIQEGIKIAERMRQEIADFNFAGAEVMPSKRITISIGVACFPDDANNSRDLVNRADNALYGAKQRDKNRVQSYHSLLADLKNNGAITDDEDLFKTMEVMISIINAKDRYTGGHSERVAEYVKAMGKKLGMEDNNLKVLTYAAFLHDLGKIEIDRKILNKPGALTNFEREDIEKHTLYGVSILEPVWASEKFLPAIKYHHERFDGKGYPEGLSGANIPLEARILALADSYDAMRSQRPYRNAIDFEKTIGELRSNAGTQFDPELVEEFIEVVTHVEFEKYREAAFTIEAENHN